MTNLLLQTIATLCLIPNGSNRDLIYSYQLECQKQYITCVNKKFNIDAHRNFSLVESRLLSECILEKKSD